MFSFNREEINMKWEMFCDPAYYDMWAVRPVGDKNFNSEKLFHFNLKDEAKKLLDYLNWIEEREGLRRILDIRDCEHRDVEGSTGQYPYARCKDCGKIW